MFVVGLRNDKHRPASPPAGVRTQIGLRTVMQFNIAVAAIMAITAYAGLTLHRVHLIALALLSDPALVGGMGSLSRCWLSCLWQLPVLPYMDSDVSR